MVGHSKKYDKTVTEIKEEIRSKYGYNGRYVSVSLLADKIYAFLKTNSDKYALNIYQNNGVIKISVREIAKHIFGYYIDLFRGQIGQALQLLENRGLIKILRKYGRSQLGRHYIIKILR